MAILKEGTTYVSGQSVTAANLNNLVAQAEFEDASGEATDDSTLEVHSAGYLQIKDLGITTGKLAALAVTAAKIANNTITAAQLASDAVSNTSIQDGTLAGSKLEDDAVTLAKMEDGTRGDVLTYDATGEPIRMAIGGASTYLRVNSAATDVEWASAAPTTKWSSGWANSLGSVTVANASTHTVTHSLGTTDVIVQVWVSTASGGTNPQLLNGTSSSGGSERGVTVTGLAADTCTVQLLSGGYLDVDSSGNAVVTSFASKYLKIVVLG